MHAYLGVAFDGAADGHAVTGHYSSVDQGLSKLWHTGHVLLLVGVSFVLQAYMYREGWVSPHKSKQNMWHALRDISNDSVKSTQQTHTCLGDGGHVLADAWLLAQAHKVFTKDAEHVCVAHDQI